MVREPRTDAQQAESSPTLLCTPSSLSLQAPPTPSAGSPPRRSPRLLLHIDTPSKFVSPPQVSSTAQQQIKTFNVPKRKEDKG